LYAQDLLGLLGIQESVTADSMLAEGDRRVEGCRRTFSRAEEG